MAEDHIVVDYVTKDSPPCPHCGKPLKITSTLHLGDHPRVTSIHVDKAEVASDV